MEFNPDNINLLIQQGIQTIIIGDACIKLSNETNYL